MLATAAFLAFWIVIGVVLFFIALRGGPRRARASLQSQSRGSRRAMGIGFAIFFLAFGVVLPLWIGIANHDSARADVDGRVIELTAAEERGREIFGQQCANCHTIAGAGGKTGPNLDVLRPPRELVIDAIDRGRQRGNGTMPAQLTQSPQTEDVAAYVARVAGQ